MASLLGYLESFYTRTQPLQSLQKLYKPFEDFEEQFEAGRVPDWEDKGEGRLARSSEGQIDLQAFESTEELLTLGILFLNCIACQLAACKTVQQRSSYAESHVRAASFQALSTFQKGHLLTKEDRCTTQTTLLQLEAR